MRKNIAGQYVDAHLSARTDGSPVTSGTTNVFVTGDNGTQTAGAGAVVHKGNGLWCYSPTQAETNYNHVVFSFVNSAAVNAGVQLYPRLSDEAQGLILANATAQSATATSVRLPASFSAGDNTINGAVLYIVAAATGAGQARAITAYNNTTKDATVDTLTVTPTGTIIITVIAAPPSLATPPNVNVTSIAANALNASALASDAVTEIVNGVLNEATSAHTTAGSVGKAIADGAASGDPMAITVPGAYAAGTAGYIIGNNLPAVLTKVNTLPAAPANETTIQAMLSALSAAIADKTGYRLSTTGVNDILRSALTQGYAADGQQFTLEQFAYMMVSFLFEQDLSGTTLVTRRLDGATAAMTFTLNDANTPTNITRTA